MYKVVRGPFKCQWCDKSITLLEKLGLPYEVEKLGMGELVKTQAKHSHPTVPMVFKYGEFIGGYDALEQSLKEDK